MKPKQCAKCEDNADVLVLDGLGFRCRKCYIEYDWTVGKTMESNLTMADMKCLEIISKKLGYLETRKYEKNMIKAKGENLHHWSYADEHLKDIFRLSIKDHNKIHRYMELDNNLPLFRTVFGELMDTKEKAERYYNLVLSLEDESYKPEILNNLFKERK